MFGKRKENHEVRQDVVTEKENLSKDDIFKKLVEEYASSRMDLIIRLRQKRITDAEFMAYVDESLKKIDADTEARDQARLMFYQYVFRYFRLTSLIEDPEISDIHCIHRADQRCHSPFPICTGSTGENRGLCITGIREQIQSRRTVKDDC